MERDSFPLLDFFLQEYITINLKRIDNKLTYLQEGTSKADIALQ